MIWCPSPLESVGAAGFCGGAGTARKGKHGGRPPVITDDMLHTVLRRRALAEHAKREAYPEAVEAAHADFTALQVGDVPRPRLTIPDRASL